MNANVKIFRDVDELKIWGNEYGFRFLRDPEDKTKYKVYFTDDDVDKLESFVRQLQAEIEALKFENHLLKKGAKIAITLPTTTLERISSI